MIKFFRTIRLRLLNENKTGRYLKYAIGEIVLVVIGILIALQLNNWNQQKKDIKVEKETLLALKEDLLSSKKQLDRKISATKDRVVYDSIVLVHLHTRQAKIDKDSLNTLVTRFKAPPTFDPEEGIINEIISTGKLNIVRNKKIRSFITSWNMNLSEVKELEGALIDLLKNKKEPYFFNYFSYRNSYNSLKSSVLSWNGEKLLKDIYFENLMIRSIDIHKTLRGRQLYFKTLITDIISEINIELKLAS